MLRRFSSLMQRFSTGWIAGASLLAFLLFTALVLPAQASRARDVGAGSPDMSFYYSAERLYQYAYSYGEAGRAEYIRARFTFDLVWPLVYGLFLATGISWITRRAFSPASRWQLANIVPVLGVLFDYLENLATSLVMARYPSPTVVVDWLATFFTMTKWILIGGSFALLLIGTVIGASRWVGAQRRR